jgi:carboxymethylenebutenolidase
LAGDTHFAVSVSQDACGIEKGMRRVPTESSFLEDPLPSQPVIEQPLEIRTPDGVTEGFLYHPEGPGPWPGVLELTDIGGLRGATRDMARRVASLRYAVLLPNVFYRTSKPPVFDVPFKAGDEGMMKRIVELSTPLTPEAMERDASAYVDFLARQPSARSGPIAVVGYCFTGAMAMRAAAARPESIAAAASFHGGRLATDAPTSPHLLLPRIKARLYFGHATDDRSMPAEAIEKLNHALEDWGGEYESETYEGAAHAWAVPDSPVYNEQQAERAFGKFRDLLATSLTKS